MLALSLTLPSVEVLLPSIFVPRAMLTELAMARADGRFPNLMAAWARVGVLIIDDFALQPLTSHQAGELLEVIEDRVLSPPRRPSMRPNSATVNNNGIPCMSVYSLV